MIWLRFVIHNYTGYAPKIWLNNFILTPSPAYTNRLSCFTGISDGWHWYHVLQSHHIQVLFLLIMDLLSLFRRSSTMLRNVKMTHKSHHVIFITFDQIQSQFLLWQLFTKFIGQDRSRVNVTHTLQSRGKKSSYALLLRLDPPLSLSDISLSVFECGYKRQ